MSFRKKYYACLAIYALIHSQNAQAETDHPSSAFEDMLIQVYKTNPRLNSERENLKIADEKVSEANAGYRPTLSADADTGRQRERVAGEPWQYGPDTSGALTAIQPIFSGFGTLEQKRAAESRVKAERARLLLIEQDTLFTAISDWLDLCEKEKIRSLNEDNLHRMYQYSEATQSRYKEGDGTTTDVAQAESRVAQGEARYAMALADRDSSRAMFERDTGITPPAADFPDVPEKLPATIEEAETSANENPQLLQARQEEDAAGHDIGAAESSLWPNIYLRGSVSEDHSPALGLDRQRDDSLTLNVSFPLYQGGGEYARIREAKLAREKARYDAVDSGRDVVERARISWNGCQSAQTVINASKKASDAAERALEGVQEEQKQGLRTLTEVLDEQSELLGTETTETQAEKNLRLDAYRLMASVGQLTGTALHLSGLPYDPNIHHDEVVPRWAGMSISQ